MSTELVKKALELFEEDTPKNRPDDKQKIMNQELSTKKYGLKKEKMKKQKLQTKKRHTFKNTKSIVDEYLKKNYAPSLEDNLYILQELDKLKPNPMAAQKVLQQHERVLTKYKLQLPESEPEEPKSVLFPEENESKKHRKKKKKRVIF